MRQIPFAETDTWLFDAALPFWAERGVDREHGGFLEELSFAGEPTGCAVKRVRTMCRQIYTFSHAALLGFEPATEISEMGFVYLDRHARLNGGAWAKVLNRQGDTIDSTPDLYDLAFVTFALAWRYRLSRDPLVLRRLHETHAFIRGSMRAEIGFVSRLPDDGVRLQNPHMHLLEASLAAFEATGDEVFLNQAGDLVQLFKSRLFDGRTLGERFDSKWVRAPAQALEPGHHFEWAWILGQYDKLAATDHAQEAHALVAFGERCGVHAPSNAVIDAVDEAGRPLLASSRAWPNTERIKAWLALHELDHTDASAPVTQSLRLLFDRYFAGGQPGLWVDKFDLAGRPLTDAVPASIVYHLLLAFSEVLRFKAR